jgi:hypothetical protein
MHQQVRAISLVAVVATILAACGPLGSSSQAVSLSDIALHSDEVPSGLKHCSALSGAYPLISHAYDHPDQDNQAWQAALAAGATDAWIEIYRGRNDIMRADVDQCSFWPTANSIDGVIGGPSIQNVVIKYKNVESAHLSFTRGDFVPLQHLGYLGTKYTVVGGQPTAKGTATGLGVDSFTEHGTSFSCSGPSCPSAFTDIFYRAYWQSGLYVSTIVAGYLPTLEDGSKAAFRVDSRIPRAAEVTAPCTGLSAGSGVVSGDHLQYPASGIPAMTIYAVSASNSHAFCSVKTAQNQTTYSIVGIPTGTYHVLAYPLIAGPPGGYTKYVVCGGKPGCAEHSLVNLTVKDGQTVTGINPNDYYGWNGKYPPEPTP